MSDIDYSILGPLSVRLTPDAPPIVLGEKLKLLLARLLVEPGTAVSVDTLGNDVWGEETELANQRNSLQGAVRQLRQRLGDTERRIVMHVGSAYRLDAEPLRIDAERFKLLARGGHALLERHPRAARAMLEEAIASWQGPLLGGHIELRWIAASAAELESIRNSAEVDLNEILLSLGEHARLEGLLRRQISEHTTDERRRAQLIRALEAMGREAEAGLAYRDAVHALGTPGTELRRLGDRIALGVRPEPPPVRSARAGHGGRSVRVLLHAVLESWTRRPGEPALGTAALLVERSGGEPHTVDAADRIVATFDDAEAAADAARALAGDPHLHCAVGLHTGGIVELGDRLVGPVPARCRLLAEAAHHGQVLVSGPARDRHWPAAELRDLGKQRYEDLRSAESVFELAGGAQADDFPPPDTLDRRPHNLPVLQTRFVGRADELATISRSVAAGELITLHGAGGCGKTRLALQLAARGISDFDDGAWFAGLAELAAGADTDAVAVAIVAQLGVRALLEEPALETLVRHLSDRSALLVIDNCEHLLAACTKLIAALRADCKQICLIATSHKPLRVDGERVIEVRAMATELGPEADALPDAVELLLERAGSLPDAASGTPDLLGDATRICVALDGSPLGIELAAGQVATRGLSGVAVEVNAMLSGDRDLDLFVSDDPGRAPRQRTIEATIRWSHDLLSPREQRVLRRLSVFCGSFSMAEAKSVAAGGELSPAVVAEVVAGLVDCSMVAPEPPLAGAARLRLKQAIRAFAFGQLERSGELERTRGDHAAAYGSLASQLAPTLFGSGEQAGLERLEADHDNLRAALSHLIEHGWLREALELVGALWWLWFSHGHFQDGSARIHTVLALDDEPSRARVRALRAASHLSWWQGDYAQTDAYNRALEACAQAIDDAWGLAWAPMGHGAVMMFADPERALTLFESSRRGFQALGRDWEAGYALQLIGGARWFAGQEEAARKAYEEAVRIFEQLGHGSVLASVRRGAGLMEARCGRLERGRAMCREALAFSEVIGDRAGAAQALNFLAAISREAGELDSAAERYADALSRAREVGELWATCSALDGIAGVACVYRDFELAARLLARSDTLAERAGYQRPPHERVRREAEDRTLNSELGERDLDRAIAEGELMSDADAVASALAFVERLP